MNVPSLQRLTILSFVFHITFFAAVFFALKQSSRFVMPSPYVVNLVESDVKSEATNGAEVVSKSPAPEIAKPVPKKEETVSPSPKEVNKLSKREEREVQDRIAALEAKKKLKSRAELRRKMDNIIPLKRGAIGGKTDSPNAAKGKRGSSVAGDYESRVRQRIWDKWGVPREMKEKKLEAIISIRIRSDGSVEIIGIEQKSGSSVFDRSALAAIRDASPLPAPPYEMEMGIRFYP